MDQGCFFVAAILFNPPHEKVGNESCNFAGNLMTWVCHVRRRIFAGEFWASLRIIVATEDLAENNAQWCQGDIMAQHVQAHSCAKAETMLEHLGAWMQRCCAVRLCTVARMVIGIGRYPVWVIIPCVILVRFTIFHRYAARGCSDLKLERGADEGPY